MTKPLLTGAFVVLALGVVAAGPQSATPQTPQFRATTTLVPIDVRVVDSKGTPVTDLSASDFVLRENGVPQTIAHFSTSSISPGAPPAPESRPRRASDAYELTADNQRTFLIVLARGLLQAPSKGVDAAIHLVQDLALPQDYVAVMAWNRATDFTTDRRVTSSVLERFKKVHGGIETALVQWQSSPAYFYSDGKIPKYIQTQIDDVFGGPRAERVRTMQSGSTGATRFDDRRARFASGAPDLVDQFEMAGFNTLDEFMATSGRTADDLNALYMGVEYMRYLAGQKHLIFVSQYGIAGWFDDDRSIGRRAADARVALDVIHAGGMPCLTAVSAAARGAPVVPTRDTCKDVAGQGPPFFTPPPDMIRTGESARAYSRQTGGQFFAHKNKNASIDLDKIDLASRFVYTLGYYPAQEPTDGKYRHIDIKLARKGLTVLARDGYFARAAIGPVETRQAVSFGRIAGAAENVVMVPDLGLADLGAAMLPGRPLRSHVAMTIDVSRVGFERQGDMNVASLEVAAFAVFKGSHQAGYQWDTVNLALTDSQLAEARRTGWHYELTIDLTAKADEVKVAAYDYASDLVGSAVVKIK